MKKNIVIKFSLLVVMAAFAFTACNNDKPNESKEVAENINDQQLEGKSAEKDAQFLVDAVSNSYDEILVAEAAIAKSANAGIKTLAKQIKDEHTALLNELKTVAGSKAVTIPTGASEDAMKETAALNEKKAVDFDKAWLEEVEDIHENSVRKYESAANDATDMAIKNWASTNLAKIKGHLDMINNMQETVK